MPKNRRLSKEFDPDITYHAFLIRNRLMKTLRRLSLKLSGRLLDFGCGIKPYESLFNVQEYVGVDFVGEGETYSKEKVDFIYDGITLPFENDSFDSIFSSEVAEHIFNFHHIIKELNRVLKPGGQILLTCPFTMPEHEMPNDFARYTSAALADIFKKNGFEIVHFEKTGNFIESLFQLWIMYVDQYILSIFRKIPVVRVVVRRTTYLFLNCCALLFSRIFPKSQTLYLNNVILAKKIK